MKKNLYIKIESGGSNYDKQPDGDSNHGKTKWIVLLVVCFITFFMGFFPLLMIFLLKQFQPIFYLVSHLLYLFFLVLSGKAIREILNIYKEFAKIMG